MNSNDQLIKETERILSEEPKCTLCGSEMDVCGFWGQFVYPICMKCLKEGGVEARMENFVNGMASNRAMA